MEGRKNKKKKGQKRRRNSGGKEESGGKKILLLALNPVRLVLLVFLSAERERVVGRIGFTFLPS